jgi:hypothetical protein
MKKTHAFDEGCESYGAELSPVLPEVKASSRGGRKFSSMSVMGHYAW